MENQCKFCSKKSSYTCPRCNVQYCSSECYRSSSHAQCSEGFYRGMVQEQLQGEGVSEESRRKMLDILKRVDDESNMEDEMESLDSDDDDDLESRMEGINLNDTESVWSALSSTEKNEFLALTQSGKTDHLIPEWSPWWSNIKPGITELDGSSGSATHASFMETCPKIKQVSLLSDISKNKPANCIPFNILNLLTAYVWTAQVFNGDHLENCIDAVDTLLTLCCVLSKGVNFHSSQMAVNAPQVESLNYPSLCESKEFFASVLAAVESIIKGPPNFFQSFYVAAALSDVYNLFSMCKDAMKAAKSKCSSHTKSSLPFVLEVNSKLPKNLAKTVTVKLSIKKVEYFLSYVREYPERICFKV